MRATGSSCSPSSAPGALEHVQLFVFEGQFSLVQKEDDMHNRRLGSFTLALKVFISEACMWQEPHRSFSANTAPAYEQVIYPRPAFKASFSAFSLLAIRTT